MITVRYKDIDFCKGMLILFVVWGHFCAHSSGLDYEKNSVTMYIRLFQMPLFFMISGLFQKRISDVASFKKNLKKTFMRLGLPLFSWSVASFIAIGLFQGSWEMISIARGVNLYWFFSCLIICKVYFSFVDLISSRYHYYKTKLIIHIISYIFLLFIPIDLFHFQFNYLFYLLGIIIMNYDIPRLPKSLFFIGVIITLIIGCFYPTKWTFYRVGMNVLDTKVSYMPLFVIVRWIIYIVATFTAFELLRWIYSRVSKSFLSSLIVKLGNKTLLIYAFHILLVADIYGYWVKQFTNGAGLLPDVEWLRYYVLASLLTVFTIIICLAIDKVFKRIHIFRLTLLGE